MTDYIKREDAIDYLTTSMNWFDADGIETSEEEKRADITELVNGVSSADVAPVRHGRWEVIDAEEPRRYGCSECKRLSWHMENYCPNCGAKMERSE
jgi:hypothetical protein